MRYDTQEFLCGALLIFLMFIGLWLLACFFFWDFIIPNSQLIRGVIIFCLVCAFAKVR